jgi:hypothetical protein
MRVNANQHLAYCTNVHRGENWSETFRSLQEYTLAVRDRVAKRDTPFAIGLRLSCQAARELADPATLRGFRRWLDDNSCYVFTINGFPFGRFHGGRVKEQVFRPDWTHPDRLAYTKLLFDLLVEIAPAGLEASVSTLPGSFKAFIQSPDQLAEIRRNLWSCVEHIARLSDRTGRDVHLGLEPEPLGLFENSAETISFFEQLAAERPRDERLRRHLGVNYDACHFAIQFEQADDAIRRFQDHYIRISKFHLSSALQVRSSRSVCEALTAFAEDVYLHQVIARSDDGSMVRYPDLPVALAAAKQAGWPVQEWRIHFHVPLHCPASELFATTAPHILDVLKMLARHPNLCSHLEIETYTWEVLPAELKNDSVVTQIAREYEWCLEHMSKHGLASAI